MTIEQAKQIYENLRAEYETKLAEAGLRYESEIYLEDEEFEKTTDESNAVSIEMDILIFTDNINKDDAYGCCTISDIKNGTVSDAAIKKGILEFEETLDAFIDEVLSTGDAEGIIKRENEIAEKESEEMMKELNSRMKTLNVAVIAIGCVCVIAAVVAIIIKFVQ